MRRTRSRLHELVARIRQKQSKCSTAVGIVVTHYFLSIFVEVFGFLGVSIVGASYSGQQFEDPILERPARRV
jgi:hypothetical protein